VQIAFDRDRLAAMDLDPATASRQVRNAVQGEEATQYSDLDRKLDVRVRAREDERSAVAGLASLDVGRSRGRTVPLGAVANVTVARGPSEIRRIAQQRAAVVSGNLEGRDLASAAADIEQVLQGVQVPPGAKVNVAGRTASWPSRSPRCGWRCCSPSSWCTWSWRASSSRCCTRSSSCSPCRWPWPAW